MSQFAPTGGHLIFLGKVREPQPRWGPVWGNGGNLTCPWVRCLPPLLCLTLVLASPQPCIFDHCIHVTNFPLSWENLITTCNEENNAERLWNFRKTYELTLNWWKKNLILIHWEEAKLFTSFYFFYSKSVIASVIFLTLMLSLGKQCKEGEFEFILLHWIIKLH